MDVSAKAETAERLVPILRKLLINLTMQNMHRKTR